MVLGHQPPCCLCVWDRAGPTGNQQVPWFWHQSPLAVPLWDPILPWGKWCDCDRQPLQTAGALRTPIRLPSRKWVPLPPAAAGIYQTHTCCPHSSLPQTMYSSCCGPQRALRAIFLTPPRCTATPPTPWKEWGVGQPAPYHHLPWQRQPGEVAVGTKCREGSGGIGARDRGHIHQLPSPTREEGVRKPTDSFPVSSAEERAQLLSATGKLTEERAEPNARAGTMTVTTTRHHHNAAITEE